MVNPFVVKVNPFVVKVNPFVVKMNPFVVKVNPFVGRKNSNVTIFLATSNVVIRKKNNKNIFNEERTFFEVVCTCSNQECSGE